MKGLCWPGLVWRPVLHPCGVLRSSLAAACEGCPQRLPASLGAELPSGLNHTSTSLSMHCSFDNAETYAGGQAEEIMGQALRELVGC